MKRSFAQMDDDGSENSAPESRRWNPLATLIADSKSGASMQELALKMEPHFRRWVREEVEKALHSHLRSSVNQIAPSQSRAYQLHFDDKLASTLFTASKVQSEDDKPVKIFLCDAYSKRRITSGPLSSIKINVVVLDGDFDPDDREDWTELEFNNKIVHKRDGKGPLLTGDLVIQLRNGAGCLGNINFTDNSSWIRSRKFRLGVKVINNSGGNSVVREGISKAFTVKDHRGEVYKKHHPPSLDDEVWRLEKIAKDGASHKRLAENGISSVKDLLRMYALNPSKLRTILGNGLSNNTWGKIIEHATTCAVNDNEWYMHRVADSVALVFNSILKIVGAILDGQNYLPVDKLDISQMQMVERFKQLAYRNPTNLVLLEDHSIIGNQPMDVLNHQIAFSNSPVSSQEAFYFPAKQDEPEMPMNSDHTTFSMPILSELQHRDQYKDSMPESSHRMQVLNSNLRNSLLMSNFTSGFYSVEDDLASGGSLDPLVIANNLTAGNSDQFGSSSWPGNALYFNSNVEPVSPNFIRMSRIGKPKARWCKIRAVIKWKIVAPKK